jgi:hypothetical protein
MKCIHCEANATYKSRISSGGRCPSCQHAFAFEPKTDALGVSDGLFARAIKDVSGDGTLFFTQKQLYYEFNRRILKRKTLACGTPAALLGLGFLIANMPHSSWKMGAGIAIASLCFMATPRPTSKSTSPLYTRVTEPQFLSYLQKWEKAHGKIERLLATPQRLEPKPLDFADVTAYSFDRVLVTEHATTAAMLVANNFHFENNCAILSLDGYPSDRFHTILAMLRRNPQLKIFYLHDATQHGIKAIHTLREPHWFPDASLRIIDLGLRPLHAQKGNMILRKGTPQPFTSTKPTAITAQEIAWLETGNYAEIESVRPAKLMRAVYQGFAQANQMEETGGGGDVILVDTPPSVWVYDSGIDVYAADSFG